MDYVYDIQWFRWSTEDNTFYAEAWTLPAIMPDGSFHNDAFPNEKQQFTIHNYKTDGFRRFRYVEEIVSEITSADGEWECKATQWLFTSEDGIRCMITVHMDEIRQRGGAGEELNTVASAKILQEVYI